MFIVLLKGFVLGFIFSVTMVPGTVWCVQLTRRYGGRTGLAAALGIALGQTLWIAGAVALMMVIWRLPLQGQLGIIFRVLAGAIFLYMSIIHLRAHKVESLACPPLAGGPNKVFSGTLAVSLGMPMRFFGYMAFCVAAGFNEHGVGLDNALLIIAGAVVGTLVWWCYMVVLARVFARKVPEYISLRSLNKLNPLSGIILLLILVLTLMPILGRL